MGRDRSGQWATVLRSYNDSDRVEVESVVDLHTVASVRCSRPPCPGLVPLTHPTNCWRANWSVADGSVSIKIKPYHRCLRGRYGHGVRNKLHRSHTGAHRPTVRTHSVIWPIRACLRLAGQQWTHVWLMGFSCGRGALGCLGPPIE